MLLCFIVAQTFFNIFHDQKLLLVFCEMTQHFWIIQGTILMQKLHCTILFFKHQWKLNSIILLDDPLLFFCLNEINGIDVPTVEMPNKTRAIFEITLFFLVN